MREPTVDLFITLDGFAYGEGSPAYFGYHGPDLDLELLAQEVLDERLIMVEYRPTPKQVKPAHRP